MSYICNIKELALSNTNFRKVVFTGKKSQLVVMDIKPGEDIGLESHEHVEQTIYLFQGTGVSVLNGKERTLQSGDVLIVTPGVNHNIINTGNEPLKIATVYAPANHIDGRVHETKQQAVDDEEDEKFGGRVR